MTISYTQEAVWESFFKEHYELDEVPIQTAKFLQEILNKYSPQNVLDNGCGCGRISKFVDILGYYCTGLDISGYAIYKALSNSKFLKKVGYLVGSSDDLPFEDSQFELVWFWRVLHNMGIQQRNSSLKEAYRVLKNNGVMICAVQSDQDPFIHTYREMGLEIPFDKNTFELGENINFGVSGYRKHFYSKQEILQAVSSVGFKIVDIKLVSEYSGLKKLNKQKQYYWSVEAIKICQE